MSFRKCTICKVEKAMEEFDGKTTYYCKPCRKEYRSSERERLASRRLHLKRQYGLTLEQFYQMESRQEGRCLICGRIPQKVMRVDHSHSTGRVRGLLCDSCNVGLGAFEDNPTYLKAAIQYLEEQE